MSEATRSGARADALLIERDGPVETLVLNDPPRNMLGLDVVDALEREVERLAGDASVRAVVIRGAGEEHFSVGMNLKQLPEGVARLGSPEALFDQRLRVLDAIEGLPKPVIAVLTGYCLGGGLELPLACHFRLAADEGARIGLPELDLGTVPAWGGSARLTPLVGLPREAQAAVQSLSGPRGRQREANAAGVGPGIVRSSSAGGAGDDPGSTSGTSSGPGSSAHSWTRCTSSPSRASDLGVFHRAMGTGSRRAYSAREPIGMRTSSAKVRASSSVTRIRSRVAHE